MTTETLLPDAVVDTLLDGVLRASGSRLGNYTYQKTLDELRSSIRAIEQAVLQSPEIQALRRDAERYRWLRDPCSGAEHVVMYGRGDYGKGLKSGSTLDDDIDAAMEQQK